MQKHVWIQEDPLSCPNCLVDLQIYAQQTQQEKEKEGKPRFIVVCPGCKRGLQLICMSVIPLEVSEGL